MEKLGIVLEWLDTRFQSEVRRAFTAGECARSCGVSVNTAKKWLSWMTAGGCDYLGVRSKRLANGIFAIEYYFTEGAMSSWKQ